MRRNATERFPAIRAAIAAAVAAVSAITASAIAAPTSVSPGALDLLRDLSGFPPIDRPLVMVETLNLGGVEREYWIVEPANGEPVLTAERLELTLGPGMPLAMVVESEIIAKFQNGTDLEQLKTTLQQQLGIDPDGVRPFGRLANVFLIETDSALAAINFSDAIRAMAGVKWAHPDGWIPTVSSGAAGGIAVEIDDGMEVISVASGENYDFGSISSAETRMVTVQVQNFEPVPTLVTLNPASVPEGFTANPPDFSEAIDPMDTASFTLTLDPDEAAGVFGGRIELETSIIGEVPFRITLLSTVFASDDAIGPDFILTYISKPDGYVIIPSNNNPPYDYGTTGIGQAVAQTFQVQNIGGSQRNSQIRLADVTENFSLDGPMNPTLAPGDLVNLTITLDALESFGLGEFDGAMLITVPGAGSRSYNFTGEVIDTPPQEEVDDPLFPDQWHLYNDGTTEGTDAGVDVRIFGAWDFTLGGVETPANRAIVAVLDNGSQPDHPDYSLNVLDCPDCVNFFDADFADDNRFFPNTTQGDHGTSVAGLVAALANELGGRGTAPEAGLLLTSFYDGEVDFSDPDPDTNGMLTLAEIADNILATAEAGAQVHSNSWGFTGVTEAPDVITEAFDTIATEGRDGKGVLVLFASGNSFVPIPYGNVLAASENVMAIGAANSKGFRSSYSNYGPWLDIVSPSNDPFDTEPPTAVAITTTDVTGETGYNPNTSENGGDYTSSFGGTSAATPIAAGVASLIFSLNPELTAKQAMRILRRSARPDPLSVGDGRDFMYPLAFSQSLGFGLIDATTSAQMAVDSVTNGGQTVPAPVTNATYSRASDGSVMLTWDNPTGSDDEFSEVLVVRHTSGWFPIDGTTYVAGESPASGVSIVAKGGAGLTQHLNMSINNLSNTRFSIYTVNLATRYSEPVTFSHLPSEPQTVFADDFDGPDTGWIATGEWERGVPSFSFGPYIQLNSAASAPNVYATDLDDFVDAFEEPEEPGKEGDARGGGTLIEHILVSPVIDFESVAGVTSGSISWDQKLDTLGEGFDIDVSVQLVDADEPDPVTAPAIRTVTTEDELAYDDYVSRWFPVNSEAIQGRNVRVRFTYVTTTGLGGWVIDNFRAAVSTNGQGPDFGPGRPRRISIPINGVITFLSFPVVESYTGDVNGDGDVNVADLAALLSAYGATAAAETFRATADSDGDGVIGFRDLSVMLSILSQASGPAAQPTAAPLK